MPTARNGMPQSITPTCLIDASIYIFQYYFSLPDRWFSEKDTYPTAAVYGYTAFLARLLKKHQPQRIAACFDESLDQCFRNDIYPDYKSSRVLPDEALAFQLRACQTITELLGIATYASERFEADDLLGSLYYRCQRSAAPVAILTRDKDLGQLIRRPQDFLWDYAKDQCFYQEDITAKMGVRPDQLVDYLALVGDAIDDIPGVPGIGAKAAATLLGRYQAIEVLLAEVAHWETSPPVGIRGAKRIAANLDEYREQIAVSQQLATIVTDLPLINRVSELSRQVVNLSAIKDFCREMGFPALYKTLASISNDPNPQIDCRLKP